MYVLLPPSETKAPGGDGPAFDPESLTFATLRPTTDRLIDALVALSEDLPAARVALGVSARLDDEIRSNGLLRSAPALPAMRRYTGVLYAALNSPKMTRAESARAGRRLLVTSALFGLLGGGDRVPAYRLSAGSRLPGLPTIAALWKPGMSAVLSSLDGPVLDLRSGAYAAFAAVPGAISVRVVTVTRAGVIKPVSHDNKAIKGRLARLVATTRATVDDLPSLLRLTHRAGLQVTRTGPSSIDLTAPAVP